MFLGNQCEMNTASFISLAKDFVEEFKSPQQASFVTMPHEFVSLLKSTNSEKDFYASLVAT